MYMQNHAARGSEGIPVPFGRVWSLVVIATLALSIAPGCRWPKLAVNEAILVSYRDMVWAKRAYNLRYGNCERPYGEHFYNGFCQGYADVCNGSDGYVPALPPSAYRTPKFQSPDGAKCVNAWFEGYPSGVAAARQEKVGNYNNVLVSKMVDTAVTTERNTNRILPSDVPVTNSKSNTTGSSPIDVAIPPNPDTASSILIPSTIDSMDNMHPARLPGASNGMVRANQSIKSPVPSHLPPIVTGSGISREARLETSQEAPTSSSGRLR
jgi:hypothetical protein